MNRFIIPHKFNYHLLEPKNNGIKGSFIILNPFHKHWINDNDRHNCNICNDKFNILNRKHHCRICGDIFCSYCTNFKFYYSITNNEPKNILVCGNCYCDYDKLFYCRPLILIHMKSKIN